MRSKDRRDDPRCWTLGDDRRSIMENEMVMGAVSGFTPTDLSLVVAAPQLHTVAARSLVALESLVTELRSRGLLDGLESREQAEGAVAHLEMLLRQIRKEKTLFEAVPGLDPE
jgi:hypothetical protein